MDVVGLALPKASEICVQMEKRNPWSNCERGSEVMK